MIPVGNTIIPQNPMTGINSISGIIGIQQQKQALQTGKYQQQSARAVAQQEQLKAQQQTGVQEFFKTWDPSQHIGDDGTTDLESALQSKEFQASGNAKPVVMQALLDIKNHQLQNKSQLATLNNALVNQLGSQAGALADDPDVKADTKDPKTGVNAGRAKVRDMFANYARLSPDAARIAQIYAPIADRAPQGKLSAGIGALQMQARDVGGQQSAQFPEAVTTPAGIVSRKPATGELSRPPIATPSRTGGAGRGGGGGGLSLNPSAPQAAAATAAGTGQVATDNERYNQVSNAGAKSQTGIALADQVSALAKQVRTGKLTKEWADRLTVLQQHDPGTTAQQMLAKYAAQLKTLAESSAGTDAERNQISSGMPSPETMGPDAVAEAAQFLHGYFRMNQARSSKASDYVQKHGTAGMALRDNQFMEHADPFVFSFKDLSRADQKAFLLKRYGNGSAITDHNGLKEFQRRFNVTSDHAGE